MLTLVGLRFEAYLKFLLDEAFSVSQKSAPPAIFFSEMSDIFDWIYLKRYTDHLLFDFYALCSLTQTGLCIV